MDPERLLRPNAFADEDGTAPAAFAAALEMTDPADRQLAIVEALATERVFVALTEPEEDGEEMAQAHVTVAGLTALAVFSSAEAVAAFDPHARPLPILGRNAAAQAFSAAGILALDPLDGAGKAADFIGRGPCAAVASGQPWTPPWKDKELHAHLRRAVEIVERCLDVWVYPAPGGANLVALQMSETSERSDAERATALVSHALTHDEYVRARLDLVHIVPVRTA